MAFPKTENELHEQGYRFERHAVCNGTTCTAQVSWYTTPKGAHMPLDAVTLEPHWAKCPDAKEFRRGKK